MQEKTEVRYKLTPTDVETYAASAELKSQYTTWISESGNLLYWPDLSVILVALARALMEMGRMKFSNGVLYGIGAAVLFGLSMPFSKLLIGEIAPLLLAGLLYFGSGIGLYLLRALRPKDKSEAPLPRSQWPLVACSMLFGGALGPVLLMFGLRLTPASSASLLLNLEGVATALIAWFIFHENFDRRIALGMVAIVAGGMLLSWQGTKGFAVAPGALLIVAACLCWGIDNNLTQKVSASDPFQIAAIKGVVAGTVNMILAFSLGATLPTIPLILTSLFVGFFGYGLSLACFVLALRHLGTARAGAYFSLAPFVGATGALLVLHEHMSSLFIGSALLMGFGVWLHLTEKHEHWHTHEYMEHTHWHHHDEHHQHDHPPGMDPRGPHSHPHVHEPMAHSHPHYPDIHHRHKHAYTPEGEVIQAPLNSSVQQKSSDGNRPDARRA